MWKKKKKKKKNLGSFKNAINKKRLQILFCPFDWCCRIHRLLLCRGVRPPPHECPGYDTKQSDGKVPAILELWGMRTYI